MKIKEAIVVEGIYDKNKLLGVVDAAVVTTDGFDIMQNTEKLDYIRTLAEKRGIVILTDSDRAGFMIRGHIKGAVSRGTVLNAYIPDIRGREKRKRKKSGEGLLGVEGVSSEIIIGALKAAGCTIDGEIMQKEAKITRQDFFDDGLIGAEQSAKKRALLIKELGLPARLSAKALLEAVNMVCSAQEYKRIMQKPM